MQVRRKRCHSVAVWAAFAAAYCLAAPVFGNPDVYVYIHAGGGDFDTTGDGYYGWINQTTSASANYPPSVPAAPVDVHLAVWNGSGISGATVIQNHAYSSADNLNSLGIASGNTLIQNTASAALSLSDLFVGDYNFNSSGIFSQSAGKVAAPYFVGVYAGSVYDLSGSGTLNTGALSMLGSTFNQSGGSATTGTLYLGDSNYGTSYGYSEGPSYYNLSGGALTVTGDDYMTAGISIGMPGTFTQTGGTHTVNGTLHIGQYQGVVGGSATFNLQAGTLTAATISLSDVPKVNGAIIPGVLNQTGGTLNYTTFNQTGGIYIGTLINKTTYNYSGGFFNGRLVNQGTVNFNADFFPLNGIENDAYMAVYSGRTITFNGGNLDNEGTLALSGGTLDGTFQKLNNGLISGNSVISGSGQLLNYGKINVSGGSLTLQMSGNPEVNYANISLESGQQLRLMTSNSPQSDRLINQGSLNLNGGVIIGTGGLQNAAGGIITGSGTIKNTLFTNLNGASLVLSSDTTNIVPAFTNSGAIVLNGLTANLAGGAITNQGTIQGFGNVASNVANTTGTIEAIGGTLVLNGTVSNAAGGLLTASTGGKLLLAGSGLPTNAGTINLTGGTFDNGNQPMVNTGEISGYGTFRTGGAGLTNSGGANGFTLAGGPATVNGPVINSSGSAIHINYIPAVFSGPVTNNAGATIKTTGASVSFAGGLTNNGTYTSDPSTNVFNGLTIGPGGSMTGGPGDRFILTAGTSFTNNGAFTNGGALTASAVSNAGTFAQTGSANFAADFNNTGSATIGGQQAWTAGTHFNNNAGVANFTSDAGNTGSRMLGVNANAGLVTFSSTQHLAAVGIGSGAAAMVSSGAPRTLVTDSLSLAGSSGAWTGKLDLGTGGLVVDYSATGSDPIAAIANQIKTGYANGAWSGAGITSTSAAAHPGHAALGYGEASTILGITGNQTATFMGQAVNADSVLARYTAFGDANLDGKVTFADFVTLSNHFGQSVGSNGWAQGDFNYDGKVTFADFVLLSNNFGALTPAQSMAISNWQAAVNPAVPEPASLAVLAIGSVGLLARRRRT